MNFDMTKPCRNCPFRRDCLEGWLGEERAAEIADSLERDRSFPCHETTKFDDDGDHVPTDSEQHCAGAMLILEKLKQPNQMMRISERLGFYDHTKLDQEGYDLVFDDFGEFIDHHAESNRDA